MKPDYEMLTFSEADGWRQWLAAHHADVDGVWIRIYKKASGVATISYAEALDQALVTDGLTVSVSVTTKSRLFRNIHHVAAKVCGLSEI